MTTDSRPATAPGELRDSTSDTGTAPLAGLHVIDLSTYVAGPSATMTLAQLGADVVRIDQIGGAPDLRRLPLDKHGNSLYWAGLNKAKRSLELNLRTEAGREIVRELLSVPGDGYGILVTNAVGQDWLSYESLRQLRPDLIQVHISGHADGRSAVDYTINSEVGLPLLTGPEDSTRPVNHVLPAWDLLTGMHAALSVLTAERVRRETGVGQLIQLNLADVATSVMAHLGYVADVTINGTDRLREGNSLYGSYGNDFQTADGRRIMVVALTKGHWRELVAVTGTEAAFAGLERSLGLRFEREAVRYEHRDLISSVLSPWFARHTSTEAARKLEQHRVLWSQYRTVKEMVTSRDGLLSQSHLFEDVLQPGVGTFPVPRPVAVMSGWSAPMPGPAPTLGVDSVAVLTQWLGVKAEKIDALKADGTLNNQAN